MVGFVITLLVIVVLLGFISYYGFKSIISRIWEKLVVLDKIFEERYNELSKTIFQFQKYMPEQKDLIFEIQRSKADAAKVSKPKTAQELAQKILNENALTINLNYLIDKCDFQKIPLELKDCVTKQTELIRQIDVTAKEYNVLIERYKLIKNYFPFKYYSKLMGIDLDLEKIKTE